MFPQLPLPSPSSSRKAPPPPPPGSNSFTRNTSAKNKLRDQNPQRGNESVFHTVYNTISQQISRFQWLPLTTMDLQCSVGCRSVLNKLCHFSVLLLLFLFFFPLIILIDSDLQMTMKRKRLLRCEQRKKKKNKPKRNQKIKKKTNLGLRASSNGNNSVCPHPTKLPL